MAKKWTSSEDNVLRNEVESFGQDATVSWIQIARKIPGRSNKDCRKRWDKIDDRWHRGAWSEAEDVRLKQAVETMGNRWAAVSEAVGTRNPNQCHKRWRNSLSPNLEKSLWTKADDDCLLAAVALYGRNWSSISQEHFRARSPLELSNRFASLSQKQRPPDSPDSSHQDPDDSNSDYVQDLLNTEAFHGIASSLVSSNPDSHPIGAVDDEHDWHDWLTTSEHNTPCTDSSRSTTVEFEVSQQSQSSLWAARKPRNGSFSRVPTSETTMQSPRATVSPAFGTRNFTSNGVEAPNEAQVLPMGVGFDMPCPSHDWPRQSDARDSALDAFPSNLGMKPGNNTTNNPNMTLTLENVDSETCGRVLQLICQRPGGTSLRVSIDEAFT